MAIPTGYENTGGPSSGGGGSVAPIPTGTSGSMTTGGGNVTTTGGTNTVGGSYFYDMAAQYAMYLGNIELQKLLENGVNERFAKQLVDNEMERSLKRSLATGYIDGNPTLDRQVQEWNRQNQLWNQGYSEQQLALDRQNSEWDRQHTLWGEGQAEQQLGLEYMNTLASMRGPRDWLTYANTVRNASNTALPAYMQALANGSSLAGYQSTLGTTSGANSFQNGTLAPQYTMDINQSISGVGQGGYVPPWQRSYGNAATATMGQTAGQNGYQAPWQQNYGGFQAGGYGGWGGGGGGGGGNAYADAIAKARNALAGLDPAWRNATDDQIVAEIKNNQSLFVNDPIRKAIEAGPQAQAQMAATQQGGGQMQPQWMNNSGQQNGQMLGGGYNQLYSNAYNGGQGGQQPDMRFQPVGQPQYTNMPRQDGQVFGGPYRGGGQGTYNNGYVQIPNWMQGQGGGQYPMPGAPTMEENYHNGVPYSQGNPYAQGNPYTQGNQYTRPDLYSQFNISANKVRPDQWNNMTGNEKQMLYGQIENAGGSPNDWADTMQRSWITGRARGTSQYGF